MDDAEIQAEIKRRLRAWDEEYERVRTGVIDGTVSVNDYRRFIGLPPMPASDAA